MYYNLLQNWQKPFTVEVYRNINLSCLFKITARQVNSKVALTIFYYINRPPYLIFDRKVTKNKAIKRHILFSQLA